jgi:hypothetical protein
MLLLTTAATTGYSWFMIGLFIATGRNGNVFMIVRMTGTAGFHRVFVRIAIATGRIGNIFM